MSGKVSDMVEDGKIIRGFLERNGPVATLAISNLLLTILAGTAVFYALFGPHRYTSEDHQRYADQDEARSARIEAKVSEYRAEALENSKSLVEVEKDNALIKQELAHISRSVQQILEKMESR